VVIKLYLKTTLRT